MKSDWLANTLYFLMPQWQLIGTPLESLWAERIQSRQLLAARWALIILAVVYVLHFGIVDRSLGLHEPFWLWYRLGLTGLAIVGLWLLHMKFIRFFKVYYIGLAITACLLQAVSIHYYEGVHYLWAVFLPLAFGALRFDPPGYSLFFTTALYVAISPVVLAADVHFSLWFGACTVCLSVLLLFCRSMKFEVADFISTHRNLQMQRELIAAQMELNSQIFAFLPKVISARIKHNLERNKGSVVESMDEVLRPKERFIVALFSDIRQFTQKSKSLEYIQRLAIPDIKESTEISERYDGVPRLIGDLVFTYFDDQDVVKNFYHALIACHDLIIQNRIRNQKNVENGSKETVIRYVLLSAGKAVVGNIGGSGSAREITALGPCVNRLARMDEMSKHSNGSIPLIDRVIVCQETGEALQRIFTDLHLEKHNLPLLGLSLRDFSEDQFVYTIAINHLSTWFQTYQNKHLRRSAA